MLVELVVARPEEFALALLHIVSPDKAPVLRLGHGPRTRATQGTPHTLLSLQLPKLLTNLAAVYAPGQTTEGVSSGPSEPDGGQDMQ